MRLTKQEELFLQRVALKIAKTGATIEQAMRAVLDDDIRIFNTYGRLSEAKQAAFRRVFAEDVYRAIHQQQGGK